MNARASRLIRYALLVLLPPFAAPPALTQQSPSYKLNESVTNSGGDPNNGVSASSVSYKISLDAIGDRAIGTGLASASFHMDGGFVSAYPPPGEVRNLQLASDEITLTWNAEKSVGTYNLYRDLVSALPGLGYGACAQSTIASATTTDPSVPGAGSSYFYLVTARNHLREEGTKGFNSAGAQRANPAPCP